MFKVAITMSVPFQILCNTIQRFHGTVRKPAEMKPVSIHPLDHDKGITDRIKVIGKGICDFMKECIWAIIIQVDQFFQSRAGGLVVISISSVKGDVAFFQIADLL